MKLINSIVNRNFVEADSILSETVELIMARKLEEAKKMCAAKMTEQGLNLSAAELTRRDVVEEEGPETNLKDADNLSTSNLLKAFNKDGAVKRILSPVNRDPKFTKDQSKSPQSSWGVSQDKQDRGLPPKDDSPAGNAKEYLRREVPAKDITVKEETEEQLDEARIKLVKARIRGGKIQRRKKVSNVAGMTIRGGKLKRMSTAERRRRKMGARKAVRKRAPKMNRALMKRKRSLMKRRALGL